MQSINRNSCLYVITLICFIALFSLGTGQPACAAQDKAAAGARFSDLATTDPNAVYVSYLVEKGLLKGYPDGTFHPQEGLTRAQAAAVIVNAARLTPVKETPPFKDVAPSHWAADSIAAAAKAGYLSGFPDGTFRPDEKLSRAQGISLILRLSKQAVSGADLPALSDMSSQHWAAKPVAVGLASGMIGLSADGKQFLPDMAFTRISLAHALGVLLTSDPGLYASNLETRIKSFQGDVKVIKATGNEQSAKVDMLINTGDIISTASGGSAELGYPDGSSVLIKEKSQVIVKEARGRKYIQASGREGIAVDWLNLEFKEGTMYGALATSHEGNASSNGIADSQAIISSKRTVASLDDGWKYIAAGQEASNKEMPWYETSKTKKVKVKVDMPWGVAAVRGTFFKINVAKDGKASVSCLTGNTEVSNHGVTVPLGDGQRTEVTAQMEAPQASTSLTKQDLGQFAEVKNWIEATAQTMDQNQEAQAPAPAVIDSSALQSAPVPVKPANPAPSTVETVNKAMDKGGVTTSTGTGSTGTTGSSGGSNHGSSAIIQSIAPLKASVIQGGSYTLPTKVTAVMGNGSSQEFPVSWNASRVDTSIPDVITLTGTVSGYGSTVSLTVDIEAPLGVEVPLLSQSVLPFDYGIRLVLRNLPIPAGATVIAKEKPAPTGLSGIEAAGTCIEFTFKGITINQPVELLIPLYKGINTSQAAIYYLNGEKWEYQPSQLRDGVVIATVNHFSVYGVFKDETAPLNPTVSIGNKTASSVELLMSAQDSSGIAAYEIYRNGLLKGTSGTPNYTDSGLQPGSTYRYQIKARDNLGNTSALSPAVEFVAISNGTDIMNITLPEQTGAARIDSLNHRVEIDVRTGTDLTHLCPTLTLSAGATVEPASATVGDFSSPLSYTVKAADGSQQIWTVIVKIQEHTGTIQGTVKDLQSGALLSGAEVKVFQNAVLITQASTVNGQYTFALAAGTGYSLTVSMPEYSPVNLSFSVTADIINYLQLVQLQSQNANQKGGISGTVSNAFDGTGVASLTINLRSGMNAESGPIIATTTTDTQGRYSLGNLAPGAYTVEASGAGYTTAYFPATCIAGAENTVANGTVSRPLDAGQTRIVLTWGESPSDLDSHLLGPASGGEQCHIYFSNKNYPSTGTAQVSLDTDDTNGYGPETTTIYQQQSSGRYSYYVFNYNGGADKLANSGAQVKVYRGDSLVASYNVPSNQSGTWWHVFNLEGNQLSPVNTISSTEPAFSESSSPAPIVYHGNYTGSENGTFIAKKYSDGRIDIRGNSPTIGAFSGNGIYDSNGQFSELVSGNNGGSFTIQGSLINQTGDSTISGTWQSSGGTNYGGTWTASPAGGMGQKIPQS